MCRARRTAGGGGSEAGRVGILIGQSKFARIALGLVGLLSGVGVFWGIGVATAEAAAVTIALAPSSDTGESSTDGVTRDNTPTIGGTAPPDARIEVRFGGRVVARATASWTGAWHVVMPVLPDGSHNLFARTAQPTDEDFVVLGLVIDTEMPPAPSIGVVGPTAKASDGSLITYDSTPALTGRAEAGTLIKVSDDSLVLGTATVDDGGLWSLTTPRLSNGEHRLVARATDKAGNSSSSGLVVTVKRRPSGAPTIALRPKSDTGASTSDGVTRDATPTVVGTAQPKAKVSVLDGNRVIATTAASKLGSWTLTLPTLRDGRHTLWARVGTAMSETVPIVVDTKKPKVPTIAVSDGLYTRTPTLSGRTTGNAIISVQEGSTVIGTTAANADGGWSFTAPVLAPSTYWFAAFATDPAGNKSSTSRAVQVITDENAALPVTIDLLASSDSSRSDDDVTRDREPTFGGTASPLAKVTVRDGATVLGTTTAEGTGDWTFQSPSLAVGAHSLTASAAGRTSEPLVVEIENGPAVIDLALLTASQGSRFDGASANAFAGFAVAAAGDVNADGYSDIIISTQNATPENARGVAYLLFGRARGWPAEIDLTYLTGIGVAMNGADNMFGLPVAGVGDVNGDGFDDVAVGEGELVYVVFGRETFPTTLELPQLDGADGGAILEFSNSVFSVARAGDVNDDGIADLIVRADEGAAVVFGRVGLTSRESWLTLDGSDGFRFHGVQFSDRPGGKSVAGIGDVNGDGVDDVAIGADGFGRRGGEDDEVTGAIFIVFGRVGDFPEYFGSSMDPSEYGIRILGSQTITIGRWIDGAGDFDGDGLNDVFASSGSYSHTSLPSRVIYGRADGYGGTLDLRSPPAGQILGLGGGGTASAAGDLDGDGISDVVVSSEPSWNTVGTTFVLYGRDIRRTGAFDLTTLDGKDGFRIVGAAMGDGLGYSVSTVPDINGDGRAEVLIGAPHADPFGRTDAGSAYLIFAPGGE